MFAEGSDQPYVRMYRAALLRYQPLGASGKMTLFARRAHLSNGAASDRPNQDDPQHRYRYASAQQCDLSIGRVVGAHATREAGSQRVGQLLQCSHLLAERSLFRASQASSSARLMLSALPLSRLTCRKAMIVSSLSR
jgi:hypothetical protein